MGDFRLWALGSALFAGVTALLIKKGVDDVPTNLALAVRVTFILIFAWLLAAATKQTRLAEVNVRAWWFLAASALTTGLSWWCYLRALQLGPVSKVAPIDKLGFVFAILLGFIFLKEAVDYKVAIGSAVIVTGVLITIS